jgi:hypothetical protein
MRPSLADLQDGRAIAAAAGISTSGARRRGKSIVPAAETRTNSAYGSMPTPDVVRGIEVPSDGLLFIAYRAQWRETVAGAARAAIFVGSSQLQNLLESSGYSAQEGRTNNSSANLWGLLVSHGVGLNGNAISSPTPLAIPTTGASLGIDQGPLGASTSRVYGGGVIAVEVAAGRYDVGVQFRATSGSVTAQDRALRVWSNGFDDGGAS